MATLKAMFQLTDGYTRTIERVMQKTDQASGKILNASGNTDKFNRQLEATGVSAGRASGGINKLIRGVLTISGLMKGMRITDEYTNTAARLDLINDGLQTQTELQDKIFAAANRSRGAYGEMASAVGKMGLLAKDAFTSNDELIAFTELVQKSFKVGGADTSEQQGAMRQLSQAMASGRLQGDELVSIMENAPMVYDAIAKYMNLSKGKLKELSSQGAITSDIIKNAMFMAADDINNKYAKMPKTFADVWNKIKNGATKAFRPLIQRVNKTINTKKFEKFTDQMVNGFSVMANAAGKALDGISSAYDYINNNWDKLVPIIEGATAAWLAYKGALLLASGAQWAVNIATAANPIGLTILLVAGLTAAVVLLWEKSEGYRKFVGSAWGFIIKVTAQGYNAYVKFFNMYRIGWNRSIDTLDLFVKATRLGMKSIVVMTGKAVAGMISLFSPLIDTIGKVIDAYNIVAKASGKKTINFDVSSKNLAGLVKAATGKAVSGIDDAFSGISGLLDRAKIDNPMRLLDLDKVNAFADYVGETIGDFTISGWLKDTFASIAKQIPGQNDDKGYDLSQFGTDQHPINVKGKVNMSDEDLRYLRDIAEREYINKFSTATLAPNISFTFGDVRETADVNEIKGTLEMMMREEIAVAAEGNY
jgi:tape measure domain-containing protein